MIRTVLSLLGALLALTGSAHASVRVVTTVPDLAAITKAIGGKQVDVTSLSLPTQDPHWVDAKPSLTLRVNKADLLIAVGLGLESGWLPVLQTGARNGRIMRGGRGYLECASFAKPLDVPTAPVDRSAGDIHPGGNPHYLYAPAGARACAVGIAFKLIEIDPGHASVYKANLATFTKQLDERTAVWTKRLAKYRGTKVLTYHKSWTYLIDWLGFVSVEHLEPKPGVPPSPGHIAHVIRVGKDQGVRLLFQETYYPSKTGSLVASKIGATQVSLPGGTDFGSGQTYLERMDAMVEALAKALASKS